MTDIISEQETPEAPEQITVHVISDSLGTTACSVVRAAAVQFDKGSVRISCLSHVSDIEQVKAYVSRYVTTDEPTAVFRTILEKALREELRREMEAAGIPSVDLLGPAMGILARLTDSEPLNIPGLVVDRDVDIVRQVDARFLDRQV